MNDTLKIVFSGLIALVIQGEIVPQNQQSDVSTAPVDAYVLKDPDHVPELLIHRDDVTATTGSRSCLDPDSACAKRTEYGHQVGKCSVADNVYRVWCLTDRQIWVAQANSAVAQYPNGARSSGGPTRHLKFKRPSEITGKNKPEDDISWVPEMKKVIKGQFKLRPDFFNDIVASMEGLRGKMIATRLSINEWDWCDMGAGDCAVVNGEPKYDQTFATAVQVSFDVVSPHLHLLPRGGGTGVLTIPLVSAPKHDIWVFNNPLWNFSSLKSETHGKETWCVATHLRHYWELVVPKPQRLRVPYFALSNNGKCPVPDPLPMATPSDTFCPPVIFGRP